MMLLDSWSAGTCEWHYCNLYIDLSNFYSFFYEALLIPFEISAFVLVLSFWSPVVTEPGPTAGIVIGVIACYA